MDLRRPDSGFYTPDPIIHLRQTGTASAHTAEGQKPEADSVLGEMKGAEQMRNARNRALSLLCAGAILVSAIPVRASAAVSDAVEGTLIQGVEGSIRIDLGDASIDGTKTVRLSGYMEPIPWSSVWTVWRAPTRRRAPGRTWPGAGTLSMRTTISSISTAPRWTR